MHTEAPVELQAFGPQLGMTDDAVVRAAGDEVQSPRTRPLLLAHRFLEFVTVALFLAAIATPMLGRWTGLVSAASAADEQRRLAPLPAWPATRHQLAAFPAAFDAYVNDNFGFRNELMRSYAVAKVFGLHDSCAPSVVVGRDGWLFLDGRVNEATDPIADARHLRPLSPQQVEDVAARFVNRRDLLASQGIAYVVLVAPNKETVYADKLPAGFEPLGDGAPSPLDQVIGRLKGTGVEFIDMRDDYAAARRRGEIVYYKTDTHWNWPGAVMAYTRLMHAVQRQLPKVDPRVLEPAPPEAFKTAVVTTPGYGLAKMMGLSDRMRETSVRYELQHPRASIKPLDPGAKHTLSIVRAADGGGGPDPRLPRAVMFHDSFSIPLMPLVSEHFGRVVYHWTMQFDRELIALEKPTVVIEETGERGLRILAGQIQPPPGKGGGGGGDGGALEAIHAGMFNAEANGVNPNMPPPPTALVQPARTAVAHAPVKSATTALNPVPLDPSASAELAKRFEASRNVCFTWKPGSADTPLRQTKQLKDVQPGKDGSLSFTATGGDPQILLPTAFEPSPESQPTPWVVRVEITSPADNLLQLFWRTATAGFSGERSKLAPLKTGRNVVYVELPDPQTRGQLRLDPGVRPGAYSIHAFEIRSCPTK